MGKYRGADGWIHYDSEERPRRYKKDDPVGHAPKGIPGTNKFEARGGGACATVVLIGSASAVLLSLCLALGFLRKVLSWLWS